MELRFVIVSWVVAAIIGMTVISVSRRSERTAKLKLRLIAGREESASRASRAFIKASGDSATAVIRALEDALLEASPEIDVLLFFDRRNHELICRYASGERARFFTSLRLAIDESSAVCDAARIGHRIASRGLARPIIPGDRAFLAIPLVRNAHTIGICYLAAGKVDAFASEDSLVTIVDSVVAAYQLALDREADRKSATIDPLTGLLTPQAFRLRLTDTCAYAETHPGLILSLLFIDTDNFKACNDLFGHAAGDIVLRALARIFSASAGPEAIVGRNGGDEFCILLSGATKTTAIRFADAVRRAVENHPFGELVGFPPAKSITASIGVAVYPEDASAADRLLETADAAMYHSKNSGRNRVSFCSQSGAVIALER